jgi:hypothetical protein
MVNSKMAISYFNDKTMSSPTVLGAYGNVSNIQIGNNASMFWKIKLVK